VNHLILSYIMKGAEHQRRRFLLELLSLPASETLGGGVSLSNQRVSIMSMRGRRAITLTLSIWWQGDQFFNFTLQLHRLIPSRSLIT